jgi:hypothetical protein
MISAAAPIKRAPRCEAAGDRLPDSLPGRVGGRSIWLIANTWESIESPNSTANIISGT